MFALFLFALQDVRYTYNPTFGIAALVLVALGLILWLMATLLGISKFKRLGSGGIWFALAALCMLLFHVHLIAFVVMFTIKANTGDMTLTLSVGLLFNLFIVLGALCALIGFGKAGSSSAVSAPPAASAEQ